MQDIMSMLQGMSQAELGEAIKKAKAYMNTPEGRKTMEKLRGGQPIDGLPVTTDQQNKLIAQLTKNPVMAKRLGEMLKR